LIHVMLKGKMPVFRVTTPRKTLLIAAQLIEDIPAWAASVANPANKDAIKEHGSDPGEIQSITRTEQYLDVVIIPESMLVERRNPDEATHPGEAKP